MRSWKQLSSGLAVCCLAGSLVGCAANTKNVGSLVLPTSNKTIDVVLHQAEIRGCLDFQVLQTYSSEGTLIDSQRGSGNTLPCVIIGAAIEAGGNVGAAAIAAKAIGKAAAAASNSSSNTLTVNANSAATTSASAAGGAGGSGGTSISQSRSNGGSNNSGGHSGGNGGHPNNGGGNGGGDGVPGHSNHSDGNR